MVLVAIEAVNQHAGVRKSPADIPAAVRLRRKRALMTDALDDDWGGGADGRAGGGHGSGGGGGGEGHAIRSGEVVQSPPVAEASCNGQMCRPPFDVGTVAVAHQQLVTVPRRRLYVQIVQPNQHAAGR